MNETQKYDERSNVNTFIANNEDDINTYLENLENTPILSEEDFYPPKDDRYFTSMVYDIEDGDNFLEYSEWFHECYDEWIED